MTDFEALVSSLAGISQSFEVNQLVTKPEDGRDAGKEVKIVFPNQKENVSFIFDNNGKLERVQ
jgi:hypothetical protein